MIFFFLKKKVYGLKKKNQNKVGKWYYGNCV